jgi:RNA polymerase sigma-70 factor (ECF subfamily)
LEERSPVPDAARPRADRGALQRSFSSLDDAAVIAAALRGTPEACEEIVRRYERPIFGLIARMVRDEAQAEDLTQDTFLKMFRALDRYDRGMRFSSWLFRIAHNTAIDYLRQRKLLVVRPADDPDDESDPLQELPDPAAISPERSAERAELASAVDQALDRVRPDYRAVLVLRYQEGLEYQEISEILGAPLGTVKTFLHRARRDLARELSAVGWGLKPGPPTSRKAD